MNREDPPKNSIHYQPTTLKIVSPAGRVDRRQNNYNLWFKLSVSNLGTRHRQNSRDSQTSSTRSNRETSEMVFPLPRKQSCGGDTKSSHARTDDQKGTISWQCTPPNRPRQVLSKPNIKAPRYPGTNADKTYSTYPHALLCVMMNRWPGWTSDENFRNHRKSYIHNHRKIMKFRMPYMNHICLLCV